MYSRPNKSSEMFIYELPRWDNVVHNPPKLSQAQIKRFATALNQVLYLPPIWSDSQEPILSLSRQAWRSRLALARMKQLEKLLPILQAKNH